MERIGGKEKAVQTIMDVFRSLLLLISLRLHMAVIEGITTHESIPRDFPLLPTIHLNTHRRQPLG